MFINRQTGLYCPNIFKALLIMETRKGLSLFILLLSALMVVTDVLISNTVLPEIRRDFHASHAQMELVIAAFLIGYAVVLIAGGRAGDRFGRKKMYIIGLIGFSVFSVLSALALQIHELIFFRLLEGAFAAIMSPQAIALIQVTFQHPEERSKAFGFFGVALGVACVLGIVGAGFFLNLEGTIAGWRLAYLITPVIGLGAAVLAARYLQETPRDDNQPFDVGGLGILTLGLVSLIYPLIVGRQAGWPLWAIASLLVSVAILGIFVTHQRIRGYAGKHVLIDMSLFGKGHYAKGLLVVICSFAAHNAFLLIYLLFIRHYAGTGFLHSAFPLTFYGVGFVISSFLVRGYVARFGRRVPQFGILVMVAALALQLVVVFLSLSPVLFCATLFVYGLGQALLLPPLLNVTLTDLPKSFAGAAVGVYYTFQQFSSTLGVAVIGGVFFTRLEKAGAHPYQSAFVYGTLAVILSLTAAGLLLQRIPAPVKKEPRDRDPARHIKPEPAKPTRRIPLLQTT